MARRNLESLRWREWFSRYPALLVLVVGLFAASPAVAELQTVGKGIKVTLVAEQFDAKYRPGFDIFAKRCTKCHEMSRPIAALQTGITPVSGHDFDAKYIKVYVVKMMRKANSGITKADAKQIILFLRHALKLAGK